MAGAVLLVATAVSFRSALLNATRAPAALTLVAELLVLAGLGRLAAVLTRLVGRGRLVADNRAVRLDADVLKIGADDDPDAIVVPRACVTQIVVVGPRPFARVHVATRDPTHPVISFPVRTGHSPDDLREHVMAWAPAAASLNDPTHGDAPPQHRTTSPEAKGRPSKRYDEAAAGDVRAGDLALPSSFAWLTRGPWFAVLLVVALVIALARRGIPLAALVRLGAVGYLALGVLIGVAMMGVGWVLLTYRRLSPRGSLAALLTPDELIVRERGGVRRIRWQAAELSVRRTERWTPLLGRLERAAIIIRDGDDKRIELAADELGWPIERALVALEAYRNGLSPSTYSPPGDAAEAGA